jgi:hypothetical protein
VSCLIHFGWGWLVDLYAHAVNWETNWVGLENVHAGQLSFHLESTEHNWKWIVEMPSFHRQGTSDLVCCDVLGRSRAARLSVSGLHDIRCRDVNASGNACRGGRRLLTSLLCRLLDSQIRIRTGPGTRRQACL